jgi:hypothetical protein
MNIGELVISTLLAISLVITIGCVRDMSVSNTPQDGEVHISVEHATGPIGDVADLTIAYENGYYIDSVFVEVWFFDAFSIGRQPYMCMEIRYKEDGFRENIVHHFADEPQVFIATAYRKDGSLMCDTAIYSKD